MIGHPKLIKGATIQETWLKAVEALSIKNWELRNLVVQICDAAHFEDSIHKKICDFAERENLSPPKHVAYTIFPEKMYLRFRDREMLFRAYNKPGGFYERINRRRNCGWGTYFRRMTYYEKGEGVENQIENVISSINTSSKIFKAAYTIVIQKPGKETVRLRGGPCLNYIAVQIEPGEQPEIGLFCVYRNQDFSGKAYGNYWGLRNLLLFMAKETGYKPGPLTCYSSRAYIDANKSSIIKFLKSL